jgi:hypothetical protein
MNIHTIFGCVTEADCTVQAVTSTTANVTLEPSCIYLLYPDEDCHIRIDAADTACTTAGPKFPGGQLVPMHTTRTRYELNVIRSTADGNLYISKLESD